MTVYELNMKKGEEEEEKRTFCTFTFPLLRRVELNIFPFSFFFHYSKSIINKINMNE